MAGTYFIHTAEDVDFRAGDHLVLTASEMGSALTQTEEVIVAEAVDARTLRLTEPLAYNHRSSWYTVDGFAPVDMRVEVGLLTRNVVVQGDENSEFQLFGSHLMAMHGAKLHLEGVEVRHCGQAFILGRYCTHYHMEGEMPNNYIRDNSIHHSFQRAVTIHATHYASIKNNVAYHVRGHTFFVEDGLERGNVIEANLAAMTLCSEGPLAGDAMPANFWTSSPSNIWRHNVAAGSCAFGYWFELPGNPDGPDFTVYICPSCEHVIEFFNNTAHTSQSHGLRVYPHWTPYNSPCDSSSGPAPQYLYNLTSWRNGGNGIFHRQVGDVHSMYPHLIENGGYAGPAMGEGGGWGVKGAAGCGRFVHVFYRCSRRRRR